MTALVISILGRIKARGWRALTSALRADSRSPPASVHPVWVALGLAFYLSACANGPLLRAAFNAGGDGWAGKASLALAVFSAVTFLHATIFLLIVPVRWMRWVGLALILASCAVSFLQQRTSVVVDPSMMRNVLNTDWLEARELITKDLMIFCAIYTGVAWLCTRSLKVAPFGKNFGQSAMARLAWASLAILLCATAIFCVMKPFASWMRSEKSARYLITPANILWSGSSTLLRDAQLAAKPRLPVALDAYAGFSWKIRKRPLVVILVVGETARAANWGLNLGFSPSARDTSPQLRSMDVINFPYVEACGTNTQVSVPCMFSFLGRHRYNEELIRQQESVLHVLSRAGVSVQWRDNQSGCKGVCDGLPQDTAQVISPASMCASGRCFDEALFSDLDERLDRAQGTQLWVFHQIGNHGPAYHRRYPPEFSHFQPACESDDLHRCNLAEIANAYDNALRYTDHILAKALRQLKEKSDSVDSALIYVSDHGESLGEGGLFLHGMPRVIAPREQLEVPMIAWVSPGLDVARGGAPGCIRSALISAANKRLSHDNLTHTLLGLFDVQTSEYIPALDLTVPCPPTRPTHEGAGL